MGDSGRIDQHPAAIQCRCGDPVCGPQPKLRADCLTRAARTFRNGSGINFNSVIQNALICFNDTPPAGVIFPFVAMPNSNCAGNDTSNNLMANSYYTNHTNFGMATVRFKPTNE